VLEGWDTAGKGGVVRRLGWALDPRSFKVHPMKRWKLSYEDFRNRASWSDYEMAVEDMLEETSTKYAPWYLIPANNKPYGRIAAFRILADRLGKDVSLEPRPIHPDLLQEAKRVLNLSPSDIERASQPDNRKARLKRYSPKS
jgi:AMP-polyphosphate phosphotransferase